MIATFVGEHMVKFPHIAEPKMSVREAFYMMGECRIRHLPVVDDGKLVGIVSERDLRQYFKTEGEKEIASVMVSTPYCVRIGTKLEQVITEMERKRVGSAIVISATSEVLGIFTTTDAMRVLRKLLHEDPAGGLARLEIDEVFERWEDYN